MQAKPQGLITILGSKHSGCMNASNNVRKLMQPEQQRAHIEPHLVASGAFARAHTDAILDCLEKLPEKMLQSLDIGLFGVYGATGAFC